ncbi:MULTISPECIES: F0F1 ATP synthase subunit delta [unclassified Spiroplasma]|uniref:F0F1 ATP synthase subunit delta n=1 Tax=unclassified Spiroplasma TaxID=2637901 RepID=UPI0030CE2D00
MIQNWAWALLKLGEEEKQLDIMLRQSIHLIKLFFEYPRIIDILSTHNLEKQKQKKIIDKIFQDKANDIFVNFFKLLIDRNNFRQVRLILKVFRNLCNERANVFYGIVFSTIKLQEEVIDKIEKKIGKILQQKVELINKIDLSLIAGIKVKVQDQIFDGSIKGRLLAMKRNIENK